MANPLYDALFAPHDGKATPFLHLADGTIITHADFLELASQMANALGTLGVMPGDRVAVHIEKSPEALALYAACVKMGAVFLPLNTAYTPAELSYFVEDSGAKLFLCDPAEVAAVAPIAQTTGAVLHSLGALGDGSFMDLARGQPTHSDIAQRGADDLAALLYTSGTTGRSKGAMLTQANLLSNAEALVEAWQFTEQDVLLHALPIFHTHGLFVATNTLLLAGGSMNYLRVFRAFRVMRLFKKLQPMRKILISLGACVQPVASAFVILFILASVYAQVARMAS